MNAAVGSEMDNCCDFGKTAKGVLSDRCRGDPMDTNLLARDQMEDSHATYSYISILA